MNDQQRLTIGEKLLDFANIGAGAMIFGMAMSEKGFNINLAVGGVIFWIIMVGFYIFFTK